MANIYGDLAKYYDLIYSLKDYKNETKKINALISKYKKSKGDSLLEVACGTGKHLEYLKKDFSCTGIDLNEGMLKLARKRHSGIKFVRGNMIDFKLGRKFDIITCMFSAIGYVKTYENLEKTLKNFSRHLNAGGIVIIEPWFTKSAYKAGNPHMSTYESKGIKIARLSVSEAKNGVSIMDMHYLIAEHNKKVKHFVDRHELGMFDVVRTLKLMKSAGFNPRFLKKGEFDNGRGIFVGAKP